MPGCAAGALVQLEPETATYSQSCHNGPYCFPVIKQAATHATHLRLRRTTHSSRLRLPSPPPNSSQCRTTKRTARKDTRHLRFWEGGTIVSYT